MLQLRHGIRQATADISELCNALRHFTARHLLDETWHDKGCLVLQTPAVSMEVFTE